jgi:hypothetical protein
MVAGIYDLLRTRPPTTFTVDMPPDSVRSSIFGAGTGRIAVSAARQGTRVIGVEPSAAMLEEFRVKLDH